MITLTLEEQATAKILMKRFAVLASIIGLSVTLCLSNAFGWDSKYRKSFALSSFAEIAEIIVVGRVVQKDFVQRVVRPNLGEHTTTDITVEVTQVVKGTPNAGKKKVKFMYLGGVSTDPVTGDSIEEIHTDEPEFSVGEEILLFLYKPNTKDYALYPHGAVQVLRGNYGKKRIVDDTIMTLYAMEDDRLQPVILPLELAIKLIKAADKDKEKVELLEKNITDAIKRNIGDDVTELSDTVIKSLSEKAQKVIDKESKSKTQETQTQD